MQPVFGSYWSPELFTLGVLSRGVPDDRLVRLHDHLAATAELPLDRTATRWVAEAEAVAADCLSIDDPEVVRERVGHVRSLLANVESTGHPEADDHVDAARELAAALA